MKNLALILIIIFSFLGYNNTSKGKENGSMKNDSINKIPFVPDISIEKKIFLHYPPSVVSSIGDIMPFMNKNTDYPFVYVLNTTGNEYLKMTFYSGNEANSISLFEVGWSSGLTIKNRGTITSFESFITESKIALGMSKEDLLKIKGNNCKEIKDGDVLLISYTIDNFATSDFLKRYNMPIYIANYWIKENKIVKYQFGFEYP